MEGYRKFHRRFLSHHKSIGNTRKSAWSCSRSFICNYSSVLNFIIHFLILSFLNLIISQSYHFSILSFFNLHSSFLSSKRVVIVILSYHFYSIFSFLPLSIPSLSLSDYWTLSCLWLRTCLVLLSQIHRRSDSNYFRVLSLSRGSRFEAPSHLRKWCIRTHRPLYSYGAWFNLAAR